MNNHFSPSIDSLKIRMPAPFVDVLRDDLLHRYTSYCVDTWDYDNNPEHFKLKALAINQELSTTRYLFSPKGRTFQKEDEVHILVNAKILGYKYREGITNNTIGLLLDRLNSQGVIKTDLDSLRNYSKCNDIDIKIDSVLEGGYPTQEIVAHQLVDLTKPSTKKHRGVNPTVNPKKVICEWSGRGIATDANPFNKFYAKDIQNEEVEDMKLFSAMHGITYEEGLSRLEATIKNKKMYEYITKKKVYDDLSLGLLLDLSDADKISLIKETFNKHLIGNKPEPKLTGGFSSLDATILGFMNAFDTLDEVLHYSLINFSCRHKRSKQKKRVLQLWELREGHQEKAGIEADAIFNLLGIS